MTILLDWLMAGNREIRVFKDGDGVRAIKVVLMDGKNYATGYFDPAQLRDSVVSLEDQIVLHFGLGESIEQDRKETAG